MPQARNTVTMKEREAFAAKLPTSVQLKLNQAFRKENIVQCFKAEACLRHVLLPLYHSNYMTETDWKQLAAASANASMLVELLDEHALIDFRPLQGFQRDWKEATKTDDDRTQMATAALLHYQGDMAAVVRRSADHM
jgi:hypothetical protein